MSNESERKNKESIEETLEVIRVFAKRVGLISIVVAVIVIGIIIAKSVKRLHNTGTTFVNKTTQIQITEPEYTLGMEKWADYDYEGAEVQLSKALESSIATRGKTAIETAGIGQKLGALYLEEGKYEEAYECLSNAYVTFRDILGEEDGNSIIAKAQICVYDIRSGNVERGFSELSDLYNTASYFKHKLDILQLQTQCYVQMGNYRMADDLYKLMASFYEQMNIRNMSLVNMLNDYGVLKLTVGNYQAAVESFSVAISVWGELGIQEDMTLATLYSNLAQAYAFLDKKDLSLKCCEMALSIQKRLFGEKGIHVAMSKASLAGAYAALDDIDMQEKQLKEALEMAIDAVGKNHACTATIYKELGDYYYSMGIADKAIECHENALEIRKNILGMDNQNTLFILDSLALDYRKKGEYDEAIEHANTEVKISEEMYGRENLYTARGYVTSAWIYSDMGMHDEATKLANTAVSICDRQKKNAGILRAYAHQTMGYAYLNASMYDDASKYLEKSRILYESMGAMNGIDYVGTLQLLSDARLALGEYDSCFIALDKAWEIATAIGEGKGGHQAEEIRKRLRELYEKDNQDPNLSFEDWLSQRREKQMKN